MRAYEDLRLAPLFISNDEGRRLATAFVVSVPFNETTFGAGYAHAYLVTAKHCVIDAAIRTPREGLRIEYPWMGEQGLAVQPICLQWMYLSPEDLPASEWSLDLAIAPLLKSAFTGHQIGESLVAVHSDSFVKQRSTALLGRETVTAGLFSHMHGDESVIEPVLRFGRVAALPRTTVSSGTGQAEAVLVEVHAAEGMSGAPVFVLSDSGDFHLMGLHVGHFTNRSHVDTPGHGTAGGLGALTHAGVAIVTPAWRIWDLLNSPLALEHRKSVEDELRQFPWRFRDRRHREIRGVVFSNAVYRSMSDHPEAQRGSHEYLIHSPADDPYFTYGDELECNTHGAAELGGLDAVKAAVAAEWPSVRWVSAEISHVTGRVHLDGQDGELTLYVDSAGQVRAIYLSDFWRDVDWGRFREARVGLERRLKRPIWFADVARGDYAAD